MTKAQGFQPKTPVPSPHQNATAVHTTRVCACRLLVPGAADAPLPHLTETPAHGQAIVPACENRARPSVPAYPVFAHAAARGQQLTCHSAIFQTRPAILPMAARPVAALPCPRESR